jgi:pyruvate dehydrogenase E1 component alpha subunit
VSGSLPDQRKTAVRDLIAKARTYGIPAITVDGNDVVACYRVNQEARLRARTGGGPTLIECQTYSWGAPPFREAKGGRNHGDSGTHICQNRTDVGHPRHEGDPLLLMQSYLAKHKLWSDEWKRKITEEIQAQIEEAIRGI